MNLFAENGIRLYTIKKKNWLNKKHKNKFATGIYEERYDTRKKVGNNSEIEWYGDKG